MIGQTLSHYRIVDKVGAGGMGDVYRARDEHLNRDVAIKVLPAGTLAEEHTRKRFRKEAEALSKLNHPHIATVHDFDTQDGVDFLVMEYVAGASLKDKLAGGPLPEKEISRLGGQVADALEAAHEQGIVHRDLKPGNIALTDRGQAKVLDFGLAKLVQSEADVAKATTVESLTQTVGMAGTLPYMAPEQLKGERVDARSDLYSFGVALHEMATGQRPFQQKLSTALSDAILHQLPPSPRTVNPRVSPGLENIILKCLEKEPERRYQSAKELVVELRALELGTRAPATDMSHRQHPRLPAWTVVLTLLVVALLLVATWPQIGAVWHDWVAPPIPERKNIVVLPFEAVGDEPGIQQSADGLRLTLTAKLTTLTLSHNLQVTPANEVRERGVRDADQARKEFGANLVIEGSLRISEGRVRIICSLVDPKTLGQLRARTITESAADLFAVEDSVVNAVATMLKLELEPAERNVLAARGTSQLDAHAFYIRGLSYLDEYDKLENLDSAITLFRQALEEDSGYAAAAAGLGEAYWRKYDVTKEVTWVEQAEHACERAVALSTELAAGHACLGMLYSGTGRYEEAATEFQRVLEAEPTSDAAYRGLAEVQQRLGRIDQAEETFHRAIELRPDYWAGYIWLGNLYVRDQSRYEQAAEQFAHAAALAPDNVHAYRNLGGVYLLLGRYEESIQALEESLGIQPSFGAYNNLGVAYFYLHRFEEATITLEKATEYAAKDYRAWGSLARAYYWTPGKRAKARAAYQQAIELAEERLAVNPRDLDARLMLAVYHAMLAERAKAFSHLKRALQTAPRDAEYFYWAAVIYHQFGERDRALGYLGQAVASGFSLATLRDAVELDDLHNDPLFQGLVVQTRDRERTDSEGVTRASE
jgi:serine/threonine-protein kinase